MKQSIGILCLTVLLFSGCSDLNITSLENTLENSITSADGKDVLADYVLNTDYLLLYFGAHWCAPCNAFTPELIDFYKEEKGGHLFQVLYVSSGKSERNMLNYMKKTGMPWPAVIYHSKARKKLEANYGGAGIPRLVLLNRNGRVLADSYKGREYIGTQPVLDNLLKRLGKRKVDPVGITKVTGETLPVTKTLAETYQIHGIGQRGSGMMAIINGKVYIVGNELDEGIVVEKITTTHVEISMEGNTYILKPIEE